MHQLNTQSPRATPNPYRGAGGVDRRAIPLVLGVGLAAVFAALMHVVGASDAVRLAVGIPLMGAFVAWGVEYGTPRPRESMPNPTPASHPASEIKITHFRRPYDLALAAVVAVLGILGTVALALARDWIAALAFAQLLLLIIVAGVYRRAIRKAYGQREDIDDLNADPHDRPAD